MTRARTLADLGSASLATDAELASEVATLNSTIGAFTSGKVLQVVRVTDSTTQSTSTYTSWVDVSGMSVTITPTESTSSILVIASFKGGFNRSTAGSCPSRYQISDSSGNSFTGANDAGLYIEGATGWSGSVEIFGYDTPATTSALTYKLRFRVGTSTSGTTFVYNGAQAGQMYAIELAA